ncbi:NAD-dependent epimerase/dehydratase family protein [Agrobacterium vitis]|uniref:NAD-dependent epimerase/dehydratase family protein n=1 Tax=Rhizobium/Agrobacterium group TaxID=227290 RepID=UPI0008DC042B|nr:MULTISPECIES: NAD-dependent epimerase/dehydratase family protein [Rhizobium/Agrobacterium group]MCF1432607.1 NAD-dependent epimerase/dehydratase family protein [Allorhizobium ampelinum]MUO87857.1 NAD-dependent epimerase/dehydratase family protein [Agrobacterium vitis]MUZ51014.1 NAD-dependent epimerase/dehydratase family protein [Agrobacterium vitis]MUZ90659.1 NAD-dependent epimerase/dehydratase family protein [Agrobacterium vitis]MVA38605.1 NAD-dependent epimerase/dehydratase family protein
MQETMLVTGGSGFVASHLILQLLEMDATVHATVRSLRNGAKTKPLTDMQARFPGKLTLYEADLLTPGSFDAAMAGCAIVFHVASPFKLPEKIKDGQREMVEPALQGTRNVLGSVNRTESVRRVVMTSTIGAIFGDYIDVRSMKNNTVAEDYFNTSSNVQNNPYHYSKVLAEKKAWKIQGEQSRWSLTTINPGMILGPSLTPASESGSLFLLDEMFKGYFFYGMPDLSLACVDVRDVAQAHIRAALNPDAKGRYILAENRTRTFLEIAGYARRVHPKPYLLPSWQIPNLVVRLIGPLFGLTQAYMTNHLGIRFALDNRRSQSELGIAYRPFEQTMADHYRGWAQQRRATA